MKIGAALSAPARLQDDWPSGIDYARAARVALHVQEVGGELLEADLGDAPISGQGKVVLRPEHSIADVPKGGSLELGVLEGVEVPRRSELSRLDVVYRTREEHERDVRATEVGNEVRV